ncbi:class I SAM-dependent methyltransferase [Allorhodopirellula heiligendammensis]|uniref:S-adenosylmethionine-dependent methyltransferase n=1 Tax=Allorhodopirellula heiligendammensis TaxID=2714739 RepID=A0A5C6BXD7_9BACT|nr:class I SAM-dependent methyltransferase [Allorhodopirellula heiligendammensis]TWU16980.1 putative S-adenosylmethionine-dependent methyltransferase [Allorhodopirellula heiligendammensis]
MKSHKSPLGDEDVRCLQEIDTQEIIRRWRDDYNIDISNEPIASEPHIHLMRGQTSMLRFFAPADIAGSDDFYSSFHAYKLEHWGDEYYNQPRWEHHELLSRLSGHPRILEVGCGSGAFLNACRRRNLDAMGVELNKASVTHAKQSGLDVFHGTISEFASACAPESFDVVCAFQVLEHISDPLAFLTDAISKLKLGGILVIAVPNSDSFLGQQDNLLDIPPHHMLQWSEASIRFLTTLLPVNVSRIRREPLSLLHRSGFEAVQNSKIDRQFPQTPRRIRSVAKRCVKLATRTPFRRLLTGQCIYVEFQKHAELAGD